MMHTGAHTEPQIPRRRAVCAGSSSSRPLSLLRSEKVSHRNTHALFLSQISSALEYRKPELCAAARLRLSSFCGADRTRNRTRGSPPTRRQPRRSEKPGSSAMQGPGALGEPLSRGRCTEITPWGIRGRNRARTRPASRERVWNRIGLRGRRRCASSALAAGLEAESRARDSAARRVRARTASGTRRF
jgi:hypothetical protein